MANMRALVGTVMALLAIGLCIGGLSSPKWYRCSASGGGVEVSLDFSLKQVTLEKSGTGGTQSATWDLCSTEYTSDGSNNTPCAAGQTATALGVIAILLLAAGALTSIALLTGKRSKGLWCSSLVTEMIAAILAIIGGITYISAMNNEATNSGTSTLLSCKAGVGPIMLIIGGLAALVSCCLYCVCCCAPDNYGLQQTSGPVVAIAVPAVNAVVAQPVFYSQGQQMQQMQYAPQQQQQYAPQQQQQYAPQQQQQQQPYSPSGQYGQQQQQQQPWQPQQQQPQYTSQ